MKIKNKRPCLISITHQGATYSLMPCGCNDSEKELPDSAFETHFVQSLIKIGLVEVTVPPADCAPGKQSSEQDSSDPEQEANEKDALIAKCVAVGITADRRWSIKRLTEALAKASLDANNQ